MDKKIVKWLVVGCVVLLAFTVANLVKRLR